MTKEEIKISIYEIIREVIGQKPDKDENSLRGDLGYDSLDEIDMMIKCERHFGIMIMDEKVENVRTVNDCIEFIHRKLTTSPTQ